MKLLQRLPGIVCAFCLMIVFLITSVEAVTYWTPGYYEHEYEKYNVTAAVRMEMDDLLQVTDEMMDYLRGDRDDLHVMTVVDGSPREFFNATEIGHMEDVRGLFLGAITLRRVCLAAAAVCVLLMAALKADLKRTLPRMLCVGTGLFFLLAAGIGLLIASDFSRYFVVFHHIFFDNDLWIFDPATDMLINIVPEGFFMDTAACIGLLCGISSAVLFGLCLFLSLRGRRRA